MKNCILCEYQKTCKNASKPLKIGDKVRTNVPVPTIGGRTTSEGFVERHGIYIASPMLENKTLKIIAIANDRYCCEHSVSSYKLEDNCWYCKTWLRVMV